MAYYKRLFSYTKNVFDSERDDAAIAYARKLRDLEDKVMIGDIFTQKLKPKELNGFGISGTVREFVVEDVYPKFIVAKATKGGFRESFSYQDFMDNDQFHWKKRSME